MNLRPRPGEDTPRAADLAAEQHFDRGSLRVVRVLVDQDHAFAIALVNRTRPVDEHGKVQTIQLHVAGGSLIDMPRPAAFALAGGRSRVEVAGTAPVAVARDEHASIESPALEHIGTSASLDDRGAADPLSRDAGASIPR